jgi:nitrile hydratase accessory protein
MRADSPSIDADLVGPVSPPRDNGEIVFGAPWERRVFGLTVAMCRSGTCNWETFRNQLITRIADDDQRPYWQTWAAALEDVLEDTAVLACGELDEHHRELLSRPAGFDHHA